MAIDKLTIGTKVANHGANASGKLSAAEFNQLVTGVNKTIDQLETMRVRLDTVTAIQTPKSPLVVDSQGGLSLTIGAGLTLDPTGKLCTTNNSTAGTYELGDFTSSKEAEEAAKQPSISGNNEVVVMRYTVSNAHKQGIIVQQVGDVRTVQYHIWDGHIYTRHIWFTDNTRTAIDTYYNNHWWQMGATHLKYDAQTRRLGLENMDGGMMNPTETAVLPIASVTQEGLMPKIGVGFDTGVDGKVNISLEQIAWV